VIRIGAFALVTLSVVFASADAPPDQYAPFGPSISTILDAKTNLSWQRFVDFDAGQTSIGNAETICQGVNKRLPTYRELLTLVDEDPHDEWDPEAGAPSPRYIDPNAFPGTPSGPFWSMSPSDNGTNKVVDFRSGESSDLSRTSIAYVRCVVGP